MHPLFVLVAYHWHVVPPASTTPHVAHVDPGQLLDAWEPARPLIVLWSGDAAALSRWTIFAEPDERVRVAYGASRDDLLRVLGRVCAATVSPPRSTDDCPFTGGWIGWIGYDAGSTLEPAVGAGRSGGAFPLAEFVRVDRAIIHDRHTGTWKTLGGCAWPLAAAVDRGFTAGPLRSRVGRAAYTAAAARAIEYIRAGDVYQVNLTHALEGEFCGSSRGLFAALVKSARPWFGAYIESDEQDRRRAILSLSPEQFLRFDPGTRMLETCPMKGTRPPEAAVELETSAKEQAELAMIVDLMRNDLGRVCELGSVRVATPRTIERHAAGGILQATARVTGRLAPGRSLGDALALTLPGGSITGVPKVRAMQIIDELEHHARGVYCGCIGFVSDSGHAAFNIAIRTAVIDKSPGPGGFSRGTLSYGVGAGIVADSDPAREWEETLQKAGILARVSSLADVQA